MSDAVGHGQPAGSSWTAVDLVDRFGAIPLARVRTCPPAGTATLEDMIRLQEQEDRRYELVDGTLVEKAVGFYEAYLATLLAGLLKTHVEARDLGIVVGADGAVEIAPNLVRIPDVAFFAWSSLPGGNIPRQPVPRIVPDLAIEVISAGNTREEMDRKLRDYFAAGCREVWYVEPSSRQLAVYNSPEAPTVLGETDQLRDEVVLPGLTISLSELFASK